MRICSREDGAEGPVVDAAVAAQAVAVAVRSGREVRVLRGEQGPQLIEGVLAGVQQAQVPAVQRPMSGQRDQRCRVGAAPLAGRRLDAAQVGGEQRIRSDQPPQPDRGVGLRRLAAPKRGCGWSRCLPSC